jgi:hypothetical protein
MRLAVLLFAAAWRVNGKLRLLTSAACASTPTALRDDDREMKASVAEEVW